MFFIAWGKVLIAAYMPHIYTTYATYSTQMNVFAIYLSIFAVAEPGRARGAVVPPLA